MKAGVARDGLSVFGRPPQIDRLGPSCQPVAVFMTMTYSRLTGARSANEAYARWRDAPMVGVFEFITHAQRHRHAGRTRHATHAHNFLHTHAHTQTDACLLGRSIRPTPDAHPYTRTHARGPGELGTCTYASTQYDGRMAVRCLDLLIILEEEANRAIRYPQGRWCLLRENSSRCRAGGRIAIASPLLRVHPVQLVKKGSIGRFCVANLAWRGLLDDVK